MEPERDGADATRNPDTVARVLRRRAGTSELWVEVTGPSMAPTIEGSASVRLVPAPRPRLGEVWAFVADDASVVVHRHLWRYRSGHLGFRGDGVGFDDPPVEERHLVGRVVTVRDSHGERRIRRSPWRILAAQLRRVRWKAGRTAQKLNHR